MGILTDLKYHLHMLEAMAFNRKDAIDRVNELLSPIIEHLVKIAIYTHTKDRDIQVQGWTDEILSWLEQIYRCAIRLKAGSRLKLKDFLVCLNDDMGRPSQIRGEINAWSRAYKDKCKRDTDEETLRLVLWDILESQFKDMANERWDEYSLLTHPKYIALTMSQPRMYKTPQ